MLSRIRIPKVIQNSTLYSVASFLQKGIGFFLIPLYTAFLTPDDYGVLNLLTSIMGFLSILFMFSLHGAASRFHYSVSNTHEQKTLWGTIIIMVIGNSIVLTVVCIVLHRWLIDPFTEGVPFWRFTIISLLCVLLNPLYLLYQQWLQITEQGRRYTINMLLNWLTVTTLNILTVAVFKWGVLGMLVSTLVVNLIFFVYSLFAFAPKVDFSFDKGIARQSLSYSAPLIPHSVSGYLSVMADRILLNKFASLDQLGLYGVASQFGTILSTITSSINQAFTPWFFREASKDSFDNTKMNYFMEGSVAVCSLIALVLVLFSPEAIRIMTSTGYHQAWQPIIFISFGFVLNGIYFFFSQPLFFFKPQFVIIVSITQLIINLCLNIILIPKYGYMGAGGAFIFSQLASTIVSLYLSFNCSKVIRFNWGRVYIVFLVFLLLSMSVFYVERVDGILIRLAIKLFLSLIVSIIVFSRYYKIVKALKYIK